MADEADTDVPDWKQIGREALTPKLREHFESIGPELVTSEVINKTYRPTKGKHFAAVIWLREKEGEERRIATVRYQRILGIAGLTLLAAIVGIYVTYWK